MLTRFLIYGFVGWSVEVLFTGLCSAVLKRDRAATARTYLWMHPIYGGALLLLESLSERLAGTHPVLRSLAYVPVIYGAEYVSGWGLRRLLGRCPWHYQEGLHLHGLIRLDYAPAWLLAGWLSEPLTRGVRKALTPSKPAPTVPALTSPPELTVVSSA